MNEKILCPRCKFIISEYPKECTTKWIQCNNCGWTFYNRDYENKGNNN